MKVRALAKGYHGVFRNPGDVFDVPDGSKKASWFEELTADEQEAVDEDAVAAARTQYENVTGKKPRARWGLETLKAKLAELTGNGK
jgi:hypothetical protein